MEIVGVSGNEQELAIEDESVRDGIAHYRESVSKAMARGAEGHTDYGLRLVGQAIAKLEPAIEAFCTIAAHRPGAHHSVKPLLDLLAPDVVAFITADVIYNEIHHYERTIQDVSIAIGRAVEDEVRFANMKAEEPKLFKRIKDNLDKSHYAYDLARRRRVLVHGSNKFNVSHDRWTDYEKSRVGLTLFHLFRESVGTVYAKPRGRGKQMRAYVHPTEELHQWIVDSRHFNEQRCPRHRPMVQVPLAWTGQEGGGYFRERLKYPLVKTRMGKLPPVCMPKVYESVNTLQETAWRVNAVMLAKVNELWDTSIELEGFPARQPYPVPPRPVNARIGEEAFESWKRAAREIHIANAKNKSKQRLAVRTRKTAERFSSYPAIYFPMQLDFRGRVYPVPDDLEPQGSDLAKGLLTFAHGKRLGADGVRWLAIHTANCFGVDGCSLEERKAWTLTHSDRIVRCAQDPIADLWWADADKPFQFLAAAIEWAGYRAEGEDFISSLPIMVDGSCNGLQHFAAMSRDEDCGSQVNLVPRDLPADIYATVAEALKAKLIETATSSGQDAEWASKWLSLGIDRKLCKKPVMVLPYGGTKEAIKQHLLDTALERRRKQGLDALFGSDLFDAAIFAADLLNDIMDAVIVRPRRVMAWLKAVTDQVSKLEIPVAWTTPAGFYAQQRYRDDEPLMVRTTVGGKVRKMQIRKDTLKLDKRQQVQGITANFVHSMDAAALMLTVCSAKQLGIHSFCAVHDCYGTVAADMQTLLDCLRQTFVAMYEQHDVLNEFRREVGDWVNQSRPGQPPIELPPPPAKGTLDLKQVLKSDFFFA